MALDIPRDILCWTIHFLKDRKQRVKLEQDCKSEWGDIPAGVPQETKLGHWLFILTIDDINNYRRACGHEPSKYVSGLCQ